MQKRGIHGVKSVRQQSLHRGVALGVPTQSNKAQQRAAQQKDAGGRIELKELFDNEFSNTSQDGQPPSIAIQKYSCTRQEIRWHHHNPSS